MDTGDRDDEGGFQYFVEVYGNEYPDIKDLHIILSDQDAAQLVSSLHKAKNLYDKRVKALSKKHTSDITEAIKVTLPAVVAGFRYEDRQYYGNSDLHAVLAAKDGEYYLALAGGAISKGSVYLDEFTIVFKTDADFDGFIRCFDPALAQSHFEKQQAADALFDATQL